MNISNTGKRLLYVGIRVDIAKGGADQVNMRNQNILEKIFPDRVDYIENMHVPTTYAEKILLGINDDYLHQVSASLSTGKYGLVFICQSLYGRMARHIKKQYPSIKILTFFHNVEIQYAKSYYKTRGIKALPFLLSVKYWENICVKYSDYLITLNSRDSNLLYQIYKRHSDLELPTTFEDKYDESKALLYSQKNDITIDYLFVGVSFFANIHGIQWFIDNVMPRCDGQLWVVGKGMDKITFNNLNNRIHIIGYVNDLAEYYYRAKCVVLPIFTGGGMKTKTAEALMYGKTIIGTPESFEGYIVDERCMITCSDKISFIQSINKMYQKDIQNNYSRELFRKHYSHSQAYKSLSDFINGLR